MLPLLVIFMAIQLFMMRNQTPPDSRTPDAILTQMRDQSTKSLDASILDTKRALDARVGALVSQKQLTSAEGDQIKLEGTILVAQAQYNAGKLKNEVPRYQHAYETMLGEWKSKKDTTLWNSVQYKTPAGVVTADGEFLLTRDTLNEQYKTDLVWGLLPGYKIIDWFVHLTGAVPAYSYAFAAFLLALMVRAVIFPLSQRQLMWGRQMSQLTPLAREIKEKYKDPNEQGMKTMELYREYGINPYAGCAPALVQLPLFYSIYNCMLHYRFEFIKGTFLWINPATSAASHGFFAPNLGMEDKTLIVIYGITMVMSTLLMPVSDPTNVRQQRLMGVGISILFAGSMLFGIFPVPAAFVLYWTFTNILATAQSLRAYRLPMPKLEKVNAPNGGVYPTAKKAKPGFGDRLREMYEQKMREAMEAQTQHAAPSENGKKAVEKKDDDIQPYRHVSGKNGKSPLGSSGAQAKHKPKKRQ